MGGPFAPSKDHVPSVEGLTTGERQAQCALSEPRWMEEIRRRNRVRLLLRFPALGTVPTHYECVGVVALAALGPLLAAGVAGCEAAG